MKIKKTAACLLAACLCLQSPLGALTASADTWNRDGQTGYEETKKASPDSADRKASGSNAALKETSGANRGVIEAEIHSALVSEKPVELTVTLHTKDGAEVGTESILLDGYSDGSEGTVSEKVSFDDLEQGTYELEISGDGYETYKQEIKVKESISRVLLINDYLTGYTYEKGQSHPGVLKSGDVDGNGEITEEDLEILLNIIHYGTGNLSDEAEVHADLNGDGAVDLVDLQYFTPFYKNPAESAAVVTEIANLQAVEVTASASNAMSGSVKDILDGDSDTALVLLPENEEEEVSADNPITLELEIPKMLTAGGITIAQPSGTENAIEDGTVTVEYVDEHGDTKVKTLSIQEETKQKVLRSRMLAASVSESAVKLTRDADGTIVINLGNQVAVKKISIRVTKTSGTKLADISKVEFLNDMETRIPAPVMNIPQELSVTAGNKLFNLTWKKEMNVTGYEVKITYDGTSEVIKTVDNSLEVKNFGGKKLKNKEVYIVSVQSINGEWRSGYCPSIEAIPVTDEKPDPPENVTVTGGYRSLKIAWKDMEDTDSYSLFYHLAGSDDEYVSKTGITENKVALDGLEEEKEYEIYLTGTNEIGESAPSAHYLGKTTSLLEPVTPNYKLINTYDEETQEIHHIEGVVNHDNKAMTPDVADGNYATSWVLKDWDAGVSYPTVGSNIGKAPIVILDDDYKMDTFIVIPDDAQPYNYTDSTVYVWTEGKDAPKDRTKVSGRMSRKTDAKGKVYYEFQCDEPVEAHRVQINFCTSNQRRISIAEVKFYYYDSLEDDIYGLYEDEMHMALKTSVTADTIADLEGRLNTPDEVSGEYHPKQEILQKELDNAVKLLSDEKVKGIIQVHTNITKKADNGAITFGGGLNAWQPLGVAARAGDTVVVYVGSPDKKAGETTNLNLIATQYHGESSAWSQTVVTGLKAGANTVEIPAITSLDTEQGGQLYVEYTGQKSRESYEVRVSGGDQVPFLDLTKSDDPDAQKELVAEYVRELEASVPEMERRHEEVHVDEQGDPVKYDHKNCVLGATDLVLKNMMLSVSSEQVLKGLSGASVEEKTEQLYDSLKAMEGMIDLFYQSKGLSNAADAPAKDRLPVCRLNIRYQRMFAGAFMYAGGLHIGIEWGSIPGMMKGVPVVTDENGRYQSGSYFGWGISHEIGHEINEGAYAIAEITNNYFALLSQSKETNDSVRFHYEDVYDKVTSGVAGRASSVFTQLGLYWQLHLAYDMGGYNFKMYDTYKDQFNNLFFARVDSYVRDTSRAPKPGGTALTLSGNVDNKLMRLACAAAEKNLLEFFERWGMTPDAATKAYASQFEKENRAVWFVNDEARDYVMQHGENGSIAADTKVESTISYQEGSNQVHISLSNNAAVPEAMLGYEIYRMESQKGQTVETPVGFVTADQTEFTDIVTTINNRVFTYKVVGYDKYLLATESVVSEPVKVSHGGYIDKAAWTVTTNMASEEDKAEEDYPCEPEKLAIDKAVDGDAATVYTGTAAGAKPQIVLNLNQTETVTGLEYTLEGEENPIKAYEIYISLDGNSWTKVKAGRFDVTGTTLTGGKQTVYFNQNQDSWLYAYDAAYVKIIATGQKGVPVSVGELDLLGQTGDNVDLFKDGIGLLNEDYHAGTGESGEEAVIPKGSLIFTGTYKGNPAYNTVLLFDQDGNVVGGNNEAGDILAGQMIFAEVPEHGELGETSEGTWIYYIEPENMPDSEKLPKKVRAELYRTDDAHTNQGERLTADTLWQNVPDILPEVSIRTSENGR